jgi:hypothetical protein
VAAKTLPLVFDVGVSISFSSVKDFVGLYYQIYKYISQDFKWQFLVLVLLDVFFLEQRE